MANSDLQQLLGLISQKENTKRRRKRKSFANKKKRYDETGSSGNAEWDAKRERRDASKKKTETVLRNSSKSSSSKKSEDKSDLPDWLGTLAPLAHWTVPLVKKIPGVNEAMDAISRPLYGASAGVEGLQKTSYDLDRKYGAHRNPFEKMADEVQNVDIFAKAAKKGFVEGFTGKKKQTFAHNLAYAAKHDPDAGSVTKFLGKNDLANAGAGFLLDVALDPTTYLGIGMVTKPYRAVKGVSSESDRILAKELESLGLKSGGVDKPISAQEYLAMMGKVNTKRVAKGATRAERKRYIKQHTLEGKNAYRSAADDTKRTRRNLENLGKIKQSVKQNQAANSAYAIKYAEETQRIFDDAINTAGIEHIQAAVAKWDSKQEAKSIGDALHGAAPPVGKTYIGGEFSDMLDDAMQVSELTSLVKNYGWYTGSQKIINKGASHPKYQKALSDIDEARDAMTEIISKWTYGDEAVGAAEIGKILDQMQHLSEADPAIKSLYSQARIAKDKAAQAPSEFEASIHTSRQQINYRKADRGKAIILRRLLAHKAAGSDIRELVDNTPIASRLQEAEKLDSRISKIKNELDNTPFNAKDESLANEIQKSHLEELRSELASLESKRTDLVASKRERLTNIDSRIAEIDEALNSAAKGNVKSTGQDVVEPGNLQREKKQLERERDGIIVDAVNKAEETNKVLPPQEILDALDNSSPEAVYNSILSGDITGEWADLFKKHVEEGAVTRRNTAVETKIRRRREMVTNLLKGEIDVRNLPVNVQKMFKQEGKTVVPKVERNGETLTLKDKDKLKKYETQADRDKAANSNKKAAEDHPATAYTVTQGSTDVPLKPKKGTKKAKGNIKPVETVIHPVTHPPHQYTFERLFQEEHGKSYQSAMNDMQIATGDYVLSGQSKTPISRTFFVDWARQHPDALGPGGFGLRITDEDGLVHTYRQYLDEAQENNISVKDARNEWTAMVKEWMQKTPDAEVNKNLMGVYKSKHSKQSAERKRNRLNEFNVGVPKMEIDKMTEPQMLESLGKGDFTGHFSNDEVRRMHTEATQQAVKDLGEKFATGDRSLSSVVGDKAYVLGRSRSADAEIDHIKETFIDMLDDNYKQAQAKGKDEVATAVDKEGAAAKVQNDLQRMYNRKEEAKAKIIEATEEAKQTQEALIKRLEEHMLISAAAKAERNGVNSIRFTLAGHKLLPDVPTPDFLYKMVEKISNRPMINKTVELWARSFNPSSKLTPELNKARLRSQSHTPELIKMHIKELHKTFGSIKPAARRQAFNAYRSSGKGTGPVTSKIQSEFDAILPYLDGSMQVGDTYLTAWQINRFLPDEFKLVPPKPGENINNFKFTSGHDIVKRMTQMGQNPDPMKAIWSLRVASEKAQADIALKNVIKDTFGIKRGDPKAAANDRDLLVEQLHEGQGWTTVSKHIGNDYVFDPQTADEINRLFDLMKPGREEDILQLYDKALHVWKGTVTVYNPGYYTRNGIGEVMMGMFDGLTNPKYYHAAARVLGHTRPDATKEALKQLDPWAALQKNPVNGGRKVAARMRSGRTLTVDEAEVLYSYSGLKSGFVSTEYDHVFPRAGSARSTGPGRALTATNDAIRGMGEKYEDYFRMAHFLYRMEKAPRGLSLDEAADWSAAYVRKYHFDYTDFTPHEKAVWMRVFPFYKWTRKALPLMASMYFTRPGNVLLYPKAMSAIGYATGSVDPMQDENGVLPNYGVDEIVPNWMQKLFSYPVGRDDENNMTYGRVATPTMDVYGMYADPVGTALGMLSPAKHLVEQSTGETIEKGDFQYSLDTGDKRIDRLLSMTPQSSLLNKWYEDNQISKEGPRFDKNGRPLPKRTSDDPIREPGVPIDEALFSWLTGLGAYENNPERQRIAKKYEGK